VTSAVFGKAFELVADLFAEILRPDDDAAVVAEARWRPGYRSQWRRA